MYHLTFPSLSVKYLLKCFYQLTIFGSQNELSEARWSWFDFRFSLFVFRSFFAFRFSLFVFRFSFFAFRFSIFELSRKIVFWHSKSYFDIRSESENAILIFKILFWHSNWVGKSYFDIQNQNSIFRLSSNVKIGFWMSKYDFPTHFECQNRIFNIKIVFSDSVRMSK